MELFLGILVLGSLIGGVVFILKLIVDLLKRRPKKNHLKGLGVCFIIMAIGVTISGITMSEEKKLANNEKYIQEKAIKKAKAEDKAKAIEIKVKVDAKQEEVKIKEEPKKEKKVAAPAPVEEEQIEVKEVKREPIVKELDRKDEIKKAIKVRLDEGKYSNVKLKDITINDNLGIDEPGYYIALVYLNFNVKNRVKTGNDVMALYSDDLVATLANKGIKDVSEVAVFWRDEYNNRDLKYAYEFKGEGFYLTDKVE